MSTSPSSAFSTVRQDGAPLRSHRRSRLLLPSGSALAPGRKLARRMGNCRYCAVLQPGRNQPKSTWSEGQKSSAETSESLDKLGADTRVLRRFLWKTQYCANCAHSFGITSVPKSTAVSSRLLAIRNIRFCIIFLLQNQIV